MKTTYKITRCFFRNDEREVIATGLTLEEAKTYCANPNTSSKTATGSAERALTRERGPWFDTFYNE
jgi:hypothetical protein